MFVFLFIFFVFIHRCLNNVVNRRIARLEDKVVLTVEMRERDSVGGLTNEYLPNGHPSDSGPRDS